MALKAKQIAVRLETDLISQIEGYQAELRQTAPGMDVSFATAVRSLLIIGLETVRARAAAAATPPAQPEKPSKKRGR